MKGFLPNRSILLTLCFFFLLGTTCSKKNDAPLSTPNDVWDIDKDGVPRFVNTDYIESDKVHQISKYRSSVGHDYSDMAEQCRSMKHYFWPYDTLDWTTVKIFSPIAGTVTRFEADGLGMKIEIASDDYPAFRFTIFHFNPLVTHSVGEHLVAGQELGTHVGSMTYSDISVRVNDPTRQGRLVSYFEVITDSLLGIYASRGAASRETFIISKALRDANPLTCSGETFTSSDTLQNWVLLN